jgi:snRNA-activating protein complex subunit 3
VALRSGTEFAENPDLPVEETIEDRFPNQFLFVNDTFYYDDRRFNSYEVANQVKTWIDEHDISVPRPLKLVPITGVPKPADEGGLGDIKGEINGDTKPVLIEDLRPILGYPYLFQHANDCEHLLIFMDIRVIGPDDPQQASYYPLLTNKPNPRRVICKICCLYSAKWETRNDELSDEDPSFWCEKCFREFHYDKEGKMSHHFLAKPYVDPAIIYGKC